eukprot:3753998-Rhodomonas_salina.1
MALDEERASRLLTLILLLSLLVAPCLAFQLPPVAVSHRRVDTTGLVLRSGRFCAGAENQRRISSHSSLLCKARSNNDESHPRMEGVKKAGLPLAREIDGAIKKLAVGSALLLSTFSLVPPDMVKAATPAAPPPAAADSAVLLLKLP